MSQKTDELQTGAEAGAAVQTPEVAAPHETIEAAAAPEAFPEKSAPLKDPGLHFEGEVAEQLGLSRSALAGWRKNGALEKGRDWAFEKGRVHYTADGLERLRGLVAGDIPVPVQTRLREKRAALVDVRVTGFMLNPMMLWAEQPDGGRVKVRVRLARKFIQGMILSVRTLEPGLVVYEGPEPRWPKDPQFWRKFPDPARAGVGVE